MRVQTEEEIALYAYNSNTSHLEYLVTNPWGMGISISLFLACEKELERRKDKGCGNSFLVQS